MAKTKQLSTSLALAVLVALVAALLGGGSAAAAPIANGELEFASDTAEYAAGEVAVPVECVGGPTSLCSGTLTLSWRGKKSVSTFSLQGGADETVLVPLPAAGRPTKIAAVATTQSFGPATTRKAILHLH